MEGLGAQPEGVHISEPTLTSSPSPRGGRRIAANFEVATPVSGTPDRLLPGAGVTQALSAAELVASKVESSLTRAIGAMTATMAEVMAVGDRNRRQDRCVGAIPRLTPDSDINKWTQFFERTMGSATECERRAVLVEKADAAMKQFVWGNPHLDVEELIERIGARFIRPKSRIERLTAFERRAQGPGESFRQFANDKLTLAQNLYGEFGDGLAEEMTVAALMRTLPSPAVKAALLGSDHWSLPHIVEVVERDEALQVSAHARSAQVPAELRPGNAPGRSWQQRRPEQPRRSPLTCFSCRGQGHLARDCPEQARGGGRTLWCATAAARRGTLPRVARNARARPGRMPFPFVMYAIRRGTSHRVVRGARANLARMIRRRARETGSSGRGAPFGRWGVACAVSAECCASVSSRRMYSGSD